MIDVENYWKVIFDMNMGIIAEESIDDVHLFMKHEGIDKLKAGWRNNSDFALDDIFLFELNTGSLEAGYEQYKRYGISYGKEKIFQKEFVQQNHRRFLNERNCS